MIVLGWQARSPALHKLGKTAHTCEDSIEGMQEGKQLNTVLGYRSTLPSAVFTFPVGKAQQVSTSHSQKLLSLWLDIYVCTSSHDSPSHLTCTFLCAMLRLKPRPHTCYTCWTSIFPLWHLFFILSRFFIAKDGFELLVLLCLLPELWDYSMHCHA